MSCGIRCVPNGKYLDTWNRDRTGQDRLPVPIVASEDLGMHMTEKPTWDRITLSKRSQ